LIHIKDCAAARLDAFLDSGRNTVLTIEDCIALSELTPEEIAAIAEDAHLPDIIAAEMGCYLVHSAGGRKRIKAMIRDDIDMARAHGDYRHAAKLKLVLKHFIAEHNEAAPAAGSVAAGGA
jgi:hypothetical protein